MLRILNFLIIILGSAFISQTVSAETQLVSCEHGRMQITQAQHTLLNLDQQRKHVQDKTRQIYQALFACHANMALPLDQVAECSKLENEAAQQLQVMIDLEITAHQTSQELKSHSIGVRLACPGSSSSPVS